MIDYITIDSVSSYVAYGASVRERNIGAPKKKSIRETVPFSNKVYDFTSIHGEIYWEDRDLEYIFEILGSSLEEMEIAKSKFLSWIMNVENEKIQDTFTPDYHFVGTFDSVSIDDSEIEKTTISVVFKAYPYRIANTAISFAYQLAASGTTTISIENNSSHRLTPTIITTVGIKITLDNVIFAVPSGEITDDTIKLASGSNTIKFQNVESQAGRVEIRFYEEVF